MKAASLKDAWDREKTEKSSTEKKEAVAAETSGQGRNAPLERGSENRKVEAKNWSRNNRPTSPIKRRKKNGPERWAKIDQSGTKGYVEIVKS